MFASRALPFAPRPATVCREPARQRPSVRRRARRWPRTLRQREILDLAKQHGKVVVEDLAAHFDVTVQTIRRDLTELCEAGKLTRVYGGAILRSGVGQHRVRGPPGADGAGEGRDRPHLRPRHPRRQRALYAARSTTAGGRLASHPGERPLDWEQSRYSAWSWSLSRPNTTVTRPPHNILSATRELLKRYVCPGWMGASRERSGLIQIVTQTVRHVRALVRRAARRDRPGTSSGSRASHWRLPRSTSGPTCPGFNRPSGVSARLYGRSWRQARRGPWSPEPHQV